MCLVVLRLWTPLQELHTHQSCVETGIRALASCSLGATLHAVGMPFLLISPPGAWSIAYPLLTADLSHGHG